jgi:hypothetical protein
VHSPESPARRGIAAATGGGAAIVNSPTLCSTLLALLARRAGRNVVQLWEAISPTADPVSDLTPADVEDALETMRGLGVVRRNPDAQRWYLGDQPAPARLDEMYAAMLAREMRRR